MFIYYICIHTHAYKNNSDKRTEICTQYKDTL